MCEERETIKKNEEILYYYNEIQYKIDNLTQGVLKNDYVKQKKVCSYIKINKKCWYCTSQLIKSIVCYNVKFCICFTKEASASCVIMSCLRQLGKQDHKTNTLQVMFTKLPRKEENYAWCFFLEGNSFSFFHSLLCCFPHNHIHNKRTIWVNIEKFYSHNFFRGIIIKVFTTFSQNLLMW